MNRTKSINRIINHNNFDVVIIGGGASGLGIAVDTASRGYSTLLLEAHDFAKGTSSRSTKLVHGGVRYLKQGDIAMVKESLKERGLMIRNAPHIVSNQEFLVPTYDWWSSQFYNIGLKIYDMMAGDLGLGPSKHLSKSATLKVIPNLNEAGLTGGVIYYDAQFDDARMAITLARTCTDLGGTVINYMKVVELLKDSNSKVVGVKAHDAETNDTYNVKAKCVINATGIFAHQVQKMDDSKIASSIKFSQGVHLVLDKSFLKSNTAIMIPNTSDGRVLFAVPWLNKVLIGTTDTEIDAPITEPKALKNEVKFLLKSIEPYLKKPPKQADIKSVYTGIRCLVNGSSKSTTTKEISREHKIIVADSNLVTVLGGKWTTYRRIAEDTVNMAISNKILKKKHCKTQHLKLHGFEENQTANHTPLSVYGADKHHIAELIKNDKSLGKKIHPDLHYVMAEVVWTVESEMAITLEDVLARRTRALFLNSKASLESAEKVANLMAQLLNKDNEWVIDQIKSYTKMAKNFM
ncbi:MAG: glycerol-3-phosphate dehydrogenase/oxidase [Flavobacteriales bacterium]|nr:glycerol-3-phosphate dehydrogenase/oxidase [Flavobacteriales bacterium]